MATNTWNIYTSWALWIFIEKTAIAQFEKSTFFMQLWDKKTLPKGQNSYKFNKVDAGSLPSAWVLSEWVAPTATSFAMTQVAVTMSQLWAFTQVSDVLLSDSPVDVLEAAWEEIWRLLWEQADTNIQADIDAWTNVIYSWDATSTATIDATDNLAAADLAEAFSGLKTNAAPTIDGSSYVAVAHPQVIHDLMTETTAGWFLDVNKYSNPEAIFRWEIGTLNWVRLISAANITVNADAWATTTDVYYTFVLGKNAYWVVTADTMEMSVKMPGSAWTADPLNQVATVWGKLRFWSALLKEEAIYRIESSSSIWANT